jgi:hypothetical protein
MVSNLRNSRENRKPRDCHVYLDGMYSYDFLTEIPLISTNIDFRDEINVSTSENLVTTGLCRSKIRETGLTMSR